MFQGLKNWGLSLRLDKCIFTIYCPAGQDNAPHHKLLFFFSIALFMFSMSAFSFQKPSFVSNKEWERALTSLLDSAVHLQNALANKADTQVSLSSTKMIYQITDLEKLSYLLPYHQHFYMQNILQKLKPPLSALLKQKAQKEENIKFISRTLTYVANMYGLNKYAVFFCRTDRSVWIRDRKIKRVSYLLSSPACEQAPRPVSRKAL